jgi:hypothetical protein
MKEIKITDPIKIISQVDCNVTTTVEDGVRITLFEPKGADIILDVAKWYIDNQNHVWLIMKSYANMVDCVGFYKGKWKNKFHISGLYSMELANMKIVESILIEEAKNKGWETTQVEYNINNNQLWLLTKGGDTIFNGKTGEWSEIIDEKKPLYTNLFEKHSFCKGDEIWRVRFHDLQPILCNPSTSDYNENSSYSEVLSSSKACLDWIYANIGRCRN